MRFSRVLNIVPLAILGALVGCDAAPVIAVHTLADPELTFAPPSEIVAEVAIWRHPEPGLDARYEDDGPATAVADETQPGGGRIVPPPERTLEERNLLAGVRAGLRQAGFRLGETAAGSPGAVYQFLASIETVTGEYDTYRRVPVFESTWGHVHTRKGLRPYQGTRSTEVIVPERRRFVHRIVTLTALPAPVRHPSPTSPSAVWRGRIIGEAEVIDADLSTHLRTVLEDWGRTASRTVDYVPDRATEPQQARGAP